MCDLLNRVNITKLIICLLMLRCGSVSSRPLSSSGLIFLQCESVKNRRVNGTFMVGGKRRGFPNKGFPSDEKKRSRIFGHLRLEDVFFRRDGTVRLSFLKRFFALTQLRLTLKSTSRR